MMHNKRGTPCDEPLLQLGYKDSNLDRRNQNPQSCHWTIPQLGGKVYGATRKNPRGTAESNSLAYGYRPIPLDSEDEIE